MDKRVCPQCGGSQYASLRETFGSTGSMTSEREWRHDDTQRIACPRSASLFTLMDEDGLVRFHWKTSYENAAVYAERYARDGDRLTGSRGRTLLTF